MRESDFHEEEDFHGRDRKRFKRARKIAQEGDRSKFKKSNLDQAKKIEAIPSDDERLKTGRVTAVTGEGVWVDVEGQSLLCILKGLIKKEKGLMKNLIAVGDFVRILPEGQEGTVVEILARQSILSRQDVTGKNQQLIAVNIDQVLITVSVLMPPLKPALIDRYLIAAEKGGMRPIIVITKIDLLDGIPEEECAFYTEFLAAYERLGYPIVSVSTRTGVGISALRALMQSKTSVFSGQSGVGKSSLLNAAFQLEQKTGDMTQKTFKGSHTTTAAQLLPLPGGGYCIDTPGIRSFGVWALEPGDLIHHFQEFAPYADGCRYPNCSHLVEPSCAVQEALEEGKISPIRYDSYRSLMEEATGGLDNRTKRKMDLQ